MICSQSLCHLIIVVSVYGMLHLISFHCNYRPHKAISVAVSSITDDHTTISIRLYCQPWLGKMLPIVEGRARGAGAILQNIAADSFIFFINSVEARWHGAIVASPNVLTCRQRCWHALEWSNGAAVANRMAMPCRQRRGINEMVRRWH